MTRFSLVALTGVALFTGAAAMAQPPAPPPGGPEGPDGPRSRPARFFEEMDVNKDNVVTRAEVTKVTEERFAALDTNHDGILSAAERDAPRQAMRQRMEDERFAALDTDHDGKLSKAEFEAGRGFGPRPPHGPDMGPEAGGPGKDGPGMDHRPGGGRGWGGPMGGHMGAMGGGDITKAEFMRRPLMMFDVMDSNDDGKITVAERDAAIETMGHHGR